MHNHAPLGRLEDAKTQPGYEESPGPTLAITSE